MSKRKAIPLGVKLQVALARFGLTTSDVQFDHVPALELRPIDPETGETIPHPNDPSAIQMLLVAEHAEKTNGTKATTAGSDKNRIATVNRITGKTPSQWNGDNRHKGKLKGRGFDKRFRKRMNGDTEPRP